MGEDSQECPENGRPPSQNGIRGARDESSTGPKPNKPKPVVRHPGGAEALNVPIRSGISRSNSGGPPATPQDGAPKRRIIY